MLFVNKIYFGLVGIVAVLVIFSSIGIVKVQAAGKITDAKNNVTVTSKIGYGDKGLENTNLQSIVGAIIRGVLTLVGALFLVLIVYGGYNWMVDRGDSERVKIAKDTITRAIVGLIIVMGAYVITGFILSRLTNAVGAGGVAVIQGILQA
jgi:hypothetical protein